MSLGSRSEKDTGDLSRRNKRMLQGRMRRLTFAEVGVEGEYPERNGAVPQASDDRAISDCLAALENNGSNWVSEPNAGLPGKRDTHRHPRVVWSGGRNPSIFLLSFGPASC